MLSTSTAGVPADQQLLMFAGRQLFPDSALLLDHLALDTYSLAHEVHFGALVTFFSSSTPWQGNTL